MVTYFNRKDLVKFGNYLLSDERKELFKNAPHQSKDENIKKEMLAERLSLVHHADVENWIEMNEKKFVYLLTRTTKEDVFEFVKPYKSLEDLLKARQLMGDYNTIREKIDKFKMFHFEASTCNLRISRLEVE